MSLAETLVSPFFANSSVLDAKLLTAVGTSGSFIDSAVVSSSLGPYYLGRELVTC